jgi:hypothetical protein
MKNTQYQGDLGCVVKANHDNGTIQGTIVGLNFLNVSWLAVQAPRPAFAGATAGKQFPPPYWSITLIINLHSNSAAGAIRMRKEKSAKFSIT